MRVQDVQLTVLVAVGHQILAEIVQRPDLTDRKFRRQPTMNQPVTFQVNGTNTAPPPASSV